MPYSDIVTALALLQFVWFGMQVGQARGKYGVQAPAVTGNEIFERHFRVQQNTLELLIALIPGLYLFGHYFNPLWAAGLGVIYLIGRQLYSMSYVKDPVSPAAQAMPERTARTDFAAGRLDRRGHAPRRALKNPAARV